MLRALSDRKLLIPLGLTVVSLITLVALGNWQMQRKAWKEGLIATIEEGLKQPPQPLPQDPSAWPALLEKEYTPLTAEGEFLHASERHFFALEGGRIAWHIYTPLKLANGAYVIVNRGSVPEDKKDVATRVDGQVAGVQILTGLIRRPGERGAFDIDTNLEKNEWYWRDLAGMTAALRADLGAEPLTVAPFFLDARAGEPANPGGLPKGGATRIDLPNKHLVYALTWYGLAAVLLCVFVAYAASRLRGSPQSSTD